jgi:phosphate-selective porin OprO and OprP
VRLGAFGGQGTNQSVPREAGGLLVGRLELRPLGELDDDEEGDLQRREAPAVALGAGVAKNWNSARARSTTGSVFQGGTVDQTHAAVDLVAKWRGAYLAAEALWKRSAVDALVSANADGSSRREPTRSAYGWVAQASYVFEHPFEVSARVSRLVPYGGTDPALVNELALRGQELGLGLSEYVNGHRFKVQATWIARTKLGVSLHDAEHTGYLLLDATL